MLLHTHIDKTSELNTLNLINPPIIKSAEIRFDVPQYMPIQYWDNLLWENLQEYRLYNFQQPEEPKSETALKIAAQLAVAKLFMAAAELLNCPKIDQIQDPGLSVYLKNFIEHGWNRISNSQMRLFHATFTRYICYPTESNLTNSEYRNWENIFDVDVKATIQSEHFHQAVYGLLTVKMLQPNVEQLQLIKNQIQIIKHPLKELLKITKNLCGWPKHTFLLAAAKILLPEDDPKESSPDKETWEKLIEYFHQSRPDTINYYLLPIYLKIIASEKTEITPAGLKITEKTAKPSVAQIAPLPQLFKAWQESTENME